MSNETESWLRNLAVQSDTGTVVVSVAGLIDAADEMRNLQRERNALAYVVHAMNCQLCYALNTPRGGCEHGLKMLEECHPGSTKGMKVFRHEQ